MFEPIKTYDVFYLERCSLAFTSNEPKLSDRHRERALFSLYASSFSFFSKPGGSSLQRLVRSDCHRKKGSGQVCGFRRTREPISASQYVSGSSKQVPGKSSASRIRCF